MREIEPSKSTHKIKPLYFHASGVVCLAASVASFGIGVSKDAKAYSDADRLYESGTGLNAHYAVARKAEEHTRTWFEGGLIALSGSFSSFAAGALLDSIRKSKVT